MCLMHYCTILLEQSPLWLPLLCGSEGEPQNLGRCPSTQPRCFLAGLPDTIYGISAAVSLPSLPDTKPVSPKKRCGASFALRSPRFYLVSLNLVSHSFQTHFSYFWMIKRSTNMSFRGRQAHLRQHIAHTKLAIWFSLFKCNLQNIQENGKSEWEHYDYPDHTTPISSFSFGALGVSKTWAFISCISWLFLQTNKKRHKTHTQTK